MKKKTILVHPNIVVFGVGDNFPKTELTKVLEKQNIQVEIVDNHHEIKNKMREQYLRINEALQPIASFAKSSKNYFYASKSKFHK